MTFDDHELRAAFNHVPEGAAARADCPPPDRLWQAVAGELPATELKEVVLHLGECPVCTESWQLAELLEKDSEDESIAPPGTPTPSFRRRLGVGALAAALAAVVGVGLLLDDGPAPPPPETFRGPETPAIQPVELVSVDSLTRDDFHLSWKGPEGDEIRYRLLIMPVGSMDAVVDVRDLALREYRVAPDLLQALPPDTKLSVLIEAGHPRRGRLQSASFYVTVR